MALADIFWPALGLMLVFEGLLPLLLPSAWRRMFSDMLRLRDGQLRFFGLVSVGLGVLLWWGTS